MSNLRDGSYAIVDGSTKISIMAATIFLFAMVFTKITPGGVCALGMLGTQIWTLFEFTNLANAWPKPNAGLSNPLATYHPPTLIAIVLFITYHGLKVAPARRHGLSYPKHQLRVSNLLNF